MTFNRMLNIVRISLMKNGFQRAEYMKKKSLFAEIGEHCFWQPRNIPPEAKLIKLHNNVVVASEVLFVNHDVLHHMFRNVDSNGMFCVHLGAIEIGNNVFIGSRSVVLPGTKVEDNVIIGAGSVVTGHLKSGGVYAGVPAKRIGDFDALMAKRMHDEVELRKKAERFEDTWKEFYLKYSE